MEGFIVRENKKKLGKEEIYKVLFKTGPGKERKLPVLTIKAKLTNNTSKNLRCIIDLMLSI